MVEDWVVMLMISQMVFELGGIWTFDRLRVVVTELFHAQDLHLDREQNSWRIFCRSKDVKISIQSSHEVQLRLQVLKPS